FDTFAPRLYDYYASHIRKLRQHPKYAGLSFGNPYKDAPSHEPTVFSCHSENLPPSAFTLPHRDVVNLAFGWCAIVALGQFDPQTGGHLVLHDLKLIIPFPHSSCILIPSAFLWHSNIPIRKQDSRASLTFYTPGGLFRFIHNEFTTEKACLRDLDEDDAELHDYAKTTRAKDGALLYSRLEEVLWPRSAELNAALF
ncbi:hypothetical protein AGABI2DRAFT_73369, partial [Agaricus bisporus var. bisporus H97]|uniref:hypothetical protein n=1 Tax=Agaricus bisporus var. bisporus (strain H97 / ATCC MYA-4626 / FGSC 10389) TaxID=936046 RepID=UPI00029F53C0